MYGDSRELSPDSSAIFSSTSQPICEAIGKSKELEMDSDNVNFHDYKKYHNNQTNSGLLRFRSAPSSLLSSFRDGIVKSDGGGGNLSSESQGLTSRFDFSWEDDDDKSLVNGYGLNSQLPAQYQRQSPGTQFSGVESGYRVVSSMGMDNQGQGKMGTNLMRKNSSPAEFLSHLTSQNECITEKVSQQFAGYATTREVGNYRVGNAANGDLSPSTSKLKRQMSFSSGVPSSFGALTRISETGSDRVEASGPDGGMLGNVDGDTQFSEFGYPFGSWNDSSQLTENLTGLKRELDIDGKLFAGTQKEELRNRGPILSHHLSLPNTSAEMASIEKLLQFQDAVPCKIRAKRGCATHPRSIAERVRRTRISERMRKLQELVPNMDKQTSTADMLDLAVDYIKDLQKQYNVLKNMNQVLEANMLLKTS